MTVLEGTTLRRGTVVPGAALRLLEGGEVSAWDHRGRRSLLVCFVHDSCEPCRGFLGSLDALAEDLRITGTRLIAAEPAPRFLGDAEPPVVVIVDRDGGAWSSYDAGGHDFPTVAELSSALWHLATTCAECEIG